MKKLFCLMFVVLVSAALFGGGVVTNTNQSASYIRMPAQAATLGIEGVYYNPAGLAYLSNGLHFSLNNQYISQTRTVVSTFPNMNSDEFEGEVLSPIFPSLYAAYKKDKLAYSFGFNPVGGGGSANFKEGLPSFEKQFAVLPGALTAQGITTTAYSINSSFDGISLNWGLQLNISYAVNDMIGISAGCRYVIAGNNYEGSIKDVMINPMHPLNANGMGEMVSAPSFFSALATAATGAGDSIEPIIIGGGGGYTLAELVDGGMITQPQADQLSGGLGATYDPDMTAVEIQGAYYGTAAAMNGYAASTSDKELEVKQNGSGISPIIGINLNINEKLNVALKYEHQMKITMENDTTKDDVNMYPDGEESPNDMPSLLTVGVGYRPFSKLYLSSGLHYFFDKNAEYRKENNDDMIDDNSWEVVFGVEYMLTQKLLASAGYIKTSIGVSDDYQNDISHALSSYSLAIGGKYFVNDKMSVDLGFINTFYDDYKKDFTGYAETLKRTSIDIAIGIGYKL
jgi:long-subunit fatty acid transport protein